MNLGHSTAFRGQGAGENGGLPQGAARAVGDTAERKATLEPLERSQIRFRNRPPVDGADHQ